MYSQPTTLDFIPSITSFYSSYLQIHQFCLLGATAALGELRGGGGEITGKQPASKINANMEKKSCLDIS